jgi:hypothetical protein
VNPGTALKNAARLRPNGPGGYVAIRIASATKAGTRRTTSVARRNRGSPTGEE